MVFAANPLGVQSDGIVDEGRGGDIDLSPDYLFESKGRVTDYGYELELRIPFKSLRYPATRVQDWGFNVVRRVQHAGQDHGAGDRGHDADHQPLHRRPPQRGARRHGQPDGQQDAEGAADQRDPLHAFCHGTELAQQV